jgi:GT2 family glycosyltransferase
VSRGPSAGAGASISLDEDLSFNFASSEPALVCNVMAGNLSVRRDRALQIGGFDENFIGVAYRFETEFARRVIAGGGKIQFQPAASMRHLRESRGGTRSHGDHRSSASPLHGVGDHYFALICGSATRARQHMLKRIIREVMTRYHLSRPWYIPVKLFGEIRACALAHRLYQSGPRLLSEAAQRDSSGEKH